VSSRALLDKANDKQLDKEQCVKEAIRPRLLMQEEADRRLSTIERHELLGHRLAGPSWGRNQASTVPGAIACSLIVSSGLQLNFHPRDKFE
jgi:hypothetical protein